MELTIFQNPKTADIEKFKVNVYTKLGFDYLSSAHQWDTIIENHYRNGYSAEGSKKILEELFKIT